MDVTKSYNFVDFAVSVGTSAALNRMISYEFGDDDFAHTGSKPSPATNFVATHLGSSVNPLVGTLGPGCENGHHVA